MMTSPDAYVSQFENAEYLDLIAERDQLISFIQNYEKNEIAGICSEEEVIVSPGPDVQYQVYLEYLAELCILMQRKYNRDYVWGERSLHEDAEK